MRHNCLRLSLAFLFAALLPLGCADEPGSPKGSGGSASGGAGGGAKGGSGGGSTAKGGSGGTSSSGGSGGKGGSGGQAGGGSGGEASGGSGGQGGDGAGGEAAGGGGGGGTSRRDGGSDAREVGRSEDAEPTPGDDGGDDSGGDEPGGGATCNDQKQDGNETDTDCGGADCPKCGGGMKCKADTDCRSGKCTAEKCADPFAADGKVAQNGNRWTITLGTVVLEVGVDQAAMITAFSIDGTNFLVSNNASNGSVFWTAPQTDWGWPPPSEMDSATYTASSANNVLTMTGPVGTDKLSITKKFWGNTANQAVTIEYTIKNSGTAAVQKAPWEISRVYPGGLTVFPNSEEPVVLPGTSGSFLAVPFTTSAGAAWWKYQKSTFTQDIKGGANDPEGWAAQINCGSTLEQACPTTGTAAGKSTIFIKEWTPTKTVAPGEKEVELYANAGHNYVEFEQQGDYQSIPAGGSITWTMHWMLRYLPSTVTPTAGSNELLDWIRSQLL